MKTKLIIALAFFMGSNLIGQIKVSTNNNIGIGSNSPVSKLSIGNDGDTKYFVNIYSPLTVDYSRALNVNQVYSSLRRYAIVGSTESGGSFAYGIYGSVSKSTATTTGRSYGVYGYAANATSGYNYGLYGYLGGTNNGAAIFGTLSGDASVSGRYAGYFYGDVKITGNAWVNGSTLVTSDITAKKDIKFIDNGNLSKITQLNSIAYKLKTPTELNQMHKITSDTISAEIELTEDELKIYSKERIGLSAQELQKIYPALVEVDNNGMLAIDYIGLIPILIEAIKEQQVQIEELQKLVIKKN